MTAVVIPSESLHDILKCELELEDQAGTSPALDDQTEVRPKPRSVTLCPTTERNEKSCQAEEKMFGEVQRRATQSAWSQTCSKHHTVKIDLTRRSDTSQAGNKKVTLVRGSSLSLVDLPTFLPASVRLGKLANISSLIQNIPIHKQLQQAAKREGRAGLPLSDKTMGKRSQWTVMCVAVGFFSSCLILVGSMLSITSEYQDQTIARMLNISLEDIQTKG